MYNVYVVGNLELSYFKIGMSSQVMYRVRQLSTNVPFDLQIFHLEPFLVESDAFNFEQKLHMHYHQNRLRGEWFEKLDVLEVPDVCARIKKFGRDVR